MARKDVTYVTIDTANLSKPLQTLADKANAAQEEYHNALLKAAGKNGTIPEGMYGKVMNSWGKTQIALSNDPWGSGGGTAKTVRL